MPIAYSTACGDAIISTLGNFSISTGKAKAKKTFDVRALVASALSGGQVLKYRAYFPESKRNILYFDPEQSPYHGQLVTQRILRLAGLPLDREPERLKFSYLRAIADPNQHREIIPHAIYNTPDVGLVSSRIRDLMLDINNSTEATRLVGDLMKWTGERNIHLHTVLHLNKGDNNTQGHTGTELNNKGECALQVTKDSTNSDRSIVAPAIIRSRPFDKFAFRLKEQAGGIYLPEVDATYVEDTKTAKYFLYQELTNEQDREALKETLGEGNVLSYGDPVPRLRSSYHAIISLEYG